MHYQLLPVLRNDMPIVCISPNFLFVCLFIAQPDIFYVKVGVNRQIIATTCLRIYPSPFPPRHWPVRSPWSGAGCRGYRWPPGGTLRTYLIHFAHVPRVAHPAKYPSRGALLRRLLRCRGNASGSCVARTGKRATAADSLGLACLHITMCPGHEGEGPGKKECKKWGAAVIVPCSSVGGRGYLVEMRLSKPP